MKNIIILIIIGVLISSCSTRRVKCKGLKAHPDYNQKYK
jgi:hypothetical protein